MNIQAINLGKIGDDTYDVIYRRNPDEYLGIEVLNIAKNDLAIYMRKWPETEQEKMHNLLLKYFVAKKTRTLRDTGAIYFGDITGKRGRTEKHVYLRGATGTANDLRVCKFEGSGETRVDFESWVPGAYAETKQERTEMAISDALLQTLAAMNL